MDTNDSNSEATTFTTRVEMLVEDSLEFIVDDDVSEGAFYRLCMDSLLRNGRLFSLVANLLGVKVIDEAIRMLDSRRDNGELGNVLLLGLAILGILIKYFYLHCCFSPLAVLHACYC